MLKLTTVCTVTIPYNTLDLATLCFSERGREGGAMEGEGGRRGEGKGREREGNREGGKGREEGRGGRGEKKGERETEDRNNTRNRISYFFSISSNMLALFFKGGRLAIEGLA